MLKKINFLFIPLLLFCFFCVILYRGLFNDPKVVSSPLLGKQVPNISYPVLNQAIGEINIKDFDGPYLINIFASWCLPCVEELPVLINEKNKNRVKIIGVNYKDDPVNANNWLATYGNPYDVVLFDKDGMKSIDLGVYGVPETFFIDTNKIIKDKKIGVLDAKFVSDNL